MGRLLIVLALIGVAILLWYAFGPQRRPSDTSRRGFFGRRAGVENPSPSDPSKNYPQGWNGRGGSYWHSSEGGDESGTVNGKRPLGPDDDPDFLDKL